MTATNRTKDQQTENNYGKTKILLLLLSCDSLASNFQTRERAKRANSSLDQNDTKMISEVLTKSDAKW